MIDGLIFLGIVAFSTALIVFGYREGYSAGFKAGQKQAQYGARVKDGQR